MAWRLAQSLMVLRGEVLAEYPGTTVYTIGDLAHQGRPSDHNPSPGGVVCAVDIMRDDPALAERIATSGAPALKYVIHHQRIYWPGKGWTKHLGEYHSHIHVSAGRGPDGSGDGPIDDPTPWLAGRTTSDQEDDDMLTLVAGEESGTKTLWLCSGLWSRRVSEADVKHLKYMAGKGAIKLWNGGEIWEGGKPSYSPEIWGRPVDSATKVEVAVDADAVVDELAQRLKD